ncbi:MAG: SMP-30/gluconolactonase/LRE family protein [Hyphomonadaceae bacterium]|nr:SMP-30/gluconolactonase/LRE family protein [Hyphomonadaceae bacterium]
MIRTLCTVSLLALAACGRGEPAAPAAPAAWTVSEFIGPSPFHGLHGLAVEEDGTILAGSVVGQAIYAVNPASGEVTERMGPPDGMADDIAFGPDGEMAWTGYLTGKVFIQTKGGAPKMISSGLPGSNSLAFTKDGKLYFTQVFLGDALYEADVTGAQPARLIRKDLGGFNGFEVGPDGMLYGPLWFKNAIVKIDPATGKDTVVAAGFQIPAAANFGPDGNLYAIDTKTGEVKRIDMQTKAVTVIATLAPALDNLAIAKDGTIYVSNMADATIYAVNPADGAVRTIVSGPLATPTDLVITDGPEGEKLHVADVFAYRVIDTTTKQITDPLRMYRNETENQLGIGAGKSKVLITSWAAGMVQEVDRATGAAKIHHGFTAPSDAIELADGRLIALEAATGNIRLVTDGDTPGEPIVTGLNFPVAMTEAAAGKLYVTETSGALASVDLATGTITRVLEGLAGPEGLDVGADGRVYLAEAGAGRVIAFDPKDGSKSVIAEGIKMGLPAAEGTLPAYTTSGVAVSKKDGSVYVASDITNAIYRITPPAK